MTIFVYSYCKNFHLILGQRNGLDDDPSLPIWQHDAVTIGRTLQCQQAKHVDIINDGHRISSEDN